MGYLKDLCIYLKIKYILSHGCEWSVTPGTCNFTATAEAAVAMVSMMQML